MVKVLSNQPMHIHPNLRIFVSGQEVAVPANIGIAPNLWKDHSMDKYIGDMGAAPIHTHDSSGTLHVESSVTARYTLGNFLKIWGLNLKGHSVSVNADGHTYKRPSSVPLKDHEQIELHIDET
ncbi:MAG: hypothetical protein U1E65_16525 [Myxococcota bacterium]